MNRTIRAIIAVALVGIIIFSAASICQNLSSAMRVDITEKKIYTLSDGTKNILGRLSQPISMKLYYAKAAAMNAPDQIKFYNDYYYFVRYLLTEYERAAHGKIQFEVIDPRPFSDEEEEALRQGLKAFPINKDENFFFGLVIQTQFGVTKSIPFFEPGRQNFVEYDITSEIDTAITRQKERIGVLSSLPVMGDDISDYMVQMMQMQGQRPQPPWGVVSHLKQKYEVVSVGADVEEIRDAQGNQVDFLLVIHPKNLPEQTLWAIDQYILAGGRAIIFVDPHMIMDVPDSQQRMMGQPTVTNSDLNLLMRNWGLEMLPETFAGDSTLALEVPTGQNRRMGKIIAYMQLEGDSFNSEHPISSELNQVLLPFAGVLIEVDGVTDPAGETDPEAEKPITLTPLIHTTEQGNTWMASSYEVTQMPPDMLNEKFTDGDSKVVMGYFASGEFKSSFPNGVVVTEPIETPPDPADQTPPPVPETRTLTGLREGADCAVAVFADADMLANGVAYQQSPFGGLMVVNDNSALLLNTIETLSGSGDLIAVRSRGNYQRPFTKVDQIEADADKETAEESALIEADIATYRAERDRVITEALNRGETMIDASEFSKAETELNLKLVQAQRKLKDVQRIRVERTDKLEARLRNLCMLAAPMIILLMAIGLSLRRSVRRRHYISHASDA
ncbi:MAG: hypothetical protein GY869_11150 [Planctomycetes bacterium]|nr:hypothetical protein [Planctomycetota bacterium]